MTTQDFTFACIALGFAVLAVVAYQLLKRRQQQPVPEVAQSLHFFPRPDQRPADDARAAYSQLADEWAARRATETPVYVPAFTDWIPVTPGSNYGNFLQSEEVLPRSEESAREAEHSKGGEYNDHGYHHDAPAYSYDSGTSVDTSSSYDSGSSSDSSSSSSDSGSSSSDSGSSSGGDS